MTSGTVLYILASVSQISVSGTAAFPGGRTLKTRFLELPDPDGDRVVPGGGQPSGSWGGKERSDISNPEKP